MLGEEKGTLIEKLLLKSCDGGNACRESLIGGW